MTTIKDYSVYLVITEEYGRGRSAVEIAKQAIGGGVDIIQLREKKKSLQDLVATGKELAALCQAAGRIFIVNDDPLLVKRVGADGVHLGQDDVVRFPLKTARDIVGRSKLIGLSASSRAEFDRANEADVDYIGFGPIFPTKLKDASIGTADIEYVMQKARKPVFFIGGICLSNVDQITARGGRNIALVRGITEADDIATAARSFKERLLASKDPVGI